LSVFGGPIPTGGDPSGTLLFEVQLTWSDGTKEILNLNQEAIDWYKSLGVLVEDVETLLTIQPSIITPTEPLIIEEETPQFFPPVSGIEQPVKISVSPSLRIENDRVVGGGK